MDSLKLLLLFISINFILCLYPEQRSGMKKIDLDDLNVEFSEENCKKVINSLINLVKEDYVFTDIAKKPPNEEYYGTVDLISDFNKIETKNRKFYDFYRDIKGVINQLKDLHFLISAKNFTENIPPIDQITMCMPFSVNIRGNSSENAEMFIEKYEPCSYFYTQIELDFINEHLNSSILSINDKSPFEYIQNLSKGLFEIKSKHGSFTLNLNYFNSFPLFFMPLSKEEATNIKFTFNDGKNLIINYTPVYVFNNENKLDDNKQKNLKRIENINVNQIEWKYSTKNPKSFQCLIDDKNKVNVFKQSTFEMFDDSEEIIQKCTEEFYSNPYPIIGIQSNNLGGNINCSSIVLQYTQVKIVQRYFEAMKYSNILKDYIKNMYYDIETCEPIKEYKKIEDDYGNGIKHYRTQVFQRISSHTIKERKKIRVKYYQKKHLKKPTEIIIFTDFSSYSSTSFFIKGLQETGGAIIVGYGGNPKLENESLDASVSSSGTLPYNYAEEYKNLTEAGFDLNRLTSFEIFNYSYQGLNPTPKEYLSYPVDERINIYQKSDDSLYDDFIAEAKKIFRKYNDEQKCNPNNMLLTYEPDNGECYYFENDIHAHGGYECDKNETKWSKICKPFYCDIGYYFDTYQNKCIKDICTETDEQGNAGEFLNDFFIIYLVVIIMLFI